MPRPSPLSIAPLLLAASLPAMAEQAYNQVALRAEVSREIIQDRMQVTLYSEAQGNDPAQLSAGLTNTLNQALKQARAVQGVQASLGNRHSYPVYDKDGQHIAAWRERGEIRLESGDFPALSRLMSQLLGELKPGGLQFGISDAIRQQNEDKMIEDAVAAFRARAELATRALGGKDYKIVSLNLGNGSFQPVMRAMAMKMEMADGQPAPDLAPGTQQVTVSADGVIEVRMP